jgi:MFS family permease
MGLVALMDQYLSGIVKTTVIPNICDEYFSGITTEEATAQFSWWEAIYLIPTFFIFLLNGLNDIIGRKLSVLILILIMGFSSLAIVFLTPSFHLFMLFYAIVTFATVSNMWSIPISEESSSEKRAKLVSVVYIIGLLPVQAFLPSFLINTLGLGWKWSYGVMFIFMIPLIVLWFFMKETRRYEIIRQEQKKGLKKRHLFGIGTIDRKDIRYIAISAFIWGCWLTTSFLFYMAGHYFMDIHGFSTGEWSIILFVVLIFTIIGGLFGGWLMDKMGRNLVLGVGCVGLAVSLGCLGFLSRNILPFAVPLTGFFISFVYSWIVVYVPEIFPTERRGSCMGWTTTTARVSYVVGPITTAILLQTFPKMDWFWVGAGLIMLLPLAIIIFFKPHETRTEELEIIEEKR